MCFVKPCIANCFSCSLKRFIVAILPFSGEIPTGRGVFGDRKSLEESGKVSKVLKSQKGQQEIDKEIAYFIGA
jgi:hypothetical protein